MDFDAVVIGSGFGGSVLACRLAEAGYGVLVLERGRRWQPEEFPRPQGDATDYPRDPDDPWIYDPEHPERRSGWIDFRVFPHMTVVQGAGVGGGSLIYANVSVPAAEVSFESGWPREIDWDEISPFYDRAGEMLDVQTVPENQLTERFELVRAAAGEIGEGDRFMPLPLAVSFDGDWSYEPIDGEDPKQVKFSKRFTNEHGVEQGTCVHLGNCDIGCDAQAKNTLDLNYLPVAEANGAEIRPLHVARVIEPIDGGYRVDFDRIDPDDERLFPGSVTARIVVLACGSLGSTELLLRCRDEHGTLPDLSEHLGRNWSSNGDFLTPAIHRGRRVAPTWGPTISGAIDFVQDPWQGERFFIQDGGLPDLLGNLLRRSGEVETGNEMARVFLEFVQRSLQEADPEGEGGGPFPHLMPWFAQGQDSADGVLELRRKWWLFGERVLHLDWDIEESERTIQTIVDMHVRLAESTGGTALVPPTWTLLKDLITPHPLGGCNMSDPPGEGTIWTDSRGRTRHSDRGVVDHRGEVFGYPNLYVADGAVIPEAIGRNPSRTIAAVAERIAAILVDEQR